MKESREAVPQGSGLRDGKGYEKSLEAARDVCFPDCGVYIGEHQSNRTL